MDAYRVLPVDREKVADFMFQGSKHETVMPSRNDIMQGMFDTYPLLQFAAYLRMKDEELD